MKKYIKVICPVAENNDCNVECCHSKPHFYSKDHCQLIPTYSECKPCLPVNKTLYDFEIKECEFIC